jgi:hypothetical protein
LSLENHGQREPLAMCDDEGFVPVQRLRSKPINISPTSTMRSTTTNTSRPMPTMRKLEDFIVQNKFEALACNVQQKVEKAVKDISTTTNRSQPAISTLVKATTPTPTPQTPVAPTTVSTDTTRRKRKNRSARKAASVKKLIDSMTRAQMARGLHGIIEEDVETIIATMNEDVDEPGDMDFSDDEEEVVSTRLERARQVEENERDFDRAMMRPRSRQAAALNMCLELEGRVMSMLVGENSDWLEFCNSFKVKEELKPEETEHGAQDRSKGPLKSLLMSCKAKPEGGEMKDSDFEGSQEEFAKVVHSLDALDMQGLHFFDAEPEAELNVSDEIPEFMDVDVAVDSGAGDNVLAAIDVPGHKVQESPGSIRGQQFKGAGGHVMANEGQMVLAMLAPTEGDHHNEVDVTWQVADVCRPLLSVSKICDKANHTVTFDAKRAVVRDTKGRIVCTFMRKGNLYIGRMKVRNPSHPSFGGQGK